MYRRMLIWLTVIVLGTLLPPATPVTAASEQPDNGVVIWNEDYSLAEDEELDGDLVVFNGDAVLASGSRVGGDVVVWNGNVAVNGDVEGNLVTSNGSIRVEENAHVRGDVVCTWNCDIERAEDARIDGDVIEGPSLRGLPFGQIGRPGLRIDVPAPDSEPFWQSGPEQLLRWIFRIVRRVVTVLVIAVIAGVVTLIWPKATDEVGRAVFQSPGTSFGVGFLTVVAATTLIIALAITICLSPAAALVALTLSAAGLFGWIAIGARVGERMLREMHANEVAPVWSAGLGTLIITLITVGLSSALCLSPLGWLLTFVIGCFGLGAVVLTRFGTNAYTPSLRAKPTPSPAGVSDAPAPPPATLEARPEPVHEDEAEDATGEESRASQDHIET